LPTHAPEINSGGELIAVDHQTWYTKAHRGLLGS
jgi:hypothetical protein